MTKKCSRCGAVKDVGMFNRDKAKPSGFQPTCRACLRLIRYGAKGASV